MRLGILQPYFFPYVGYFQLIAAVDRFVIYDDVAFIKNGWINRNRILVPGGVEYLTIPLSGASSFHSIRETSCAPPSKWRDKMLRTLSQCYARAPEKSAGLGLVEETLAAATSGTIRDVAVASLGAVCRYADLRTDCVETSGSYENTNLSGQDRVLDICARETAGTYVNPSGGRALYDAAAFAARGVTLRFFEPALAAYPQSRSSAFVAGLSVLDLIMSVPQADVARHLRDGHAVP
jgi:hypothetical protein